MRLPILISLLLVSGCSPSDNRNATATAQPSTQRGEEPATSASAQAAKAVVERYFALIGERKYDEARLLWGNGGADTRGSAADFAKSFAAYTEYRPRTGAPTEIKATPDGQFVTVAADLHVKLKAGGRIEERSGAVMLRRSLDPKDPVADKRDWRIWGMDVRVRH